MKKTILFSFLSVLMINCSEDSDAFSSAFGLNSTTMRANDLLQASATSSSSSAISSRKDAYHQLYAKSVFALRIPGGAMQQFFNTDRTHFTPGSNPITGSFGTSPSLLNHDEFEMIFADSELDNNFATATNELKDQIDYLINLYNERNKWLYVLGGIDEELRKPEGSQTQQINNLKAKLTALGIDISEYTGLLELREVLKDQNNYFKFKGADTDINAVIQSVNSLTDQIDDMEQEYKMLAEVLKLNVAEFSDNSLELETKFNKTWEKIGGSINKLRKSLPIYNAKKNIGTQLIKNIGSTVSTDYTANSALLQNRIVFQQNDPRLDYILKYDLDKFSFATAQTTVTEGIFAQLRDRALRNEFREKSGFSWKDMQDLMMHELFVARNKGNLLLQQFITSVINDMYDTPEFWAPATEEEAKYAEEDAKRLAFLMAEGGIFKVDPNFGVKNNATQTLQRYVGAINRLTEGSLQDVDHAALNNSSIPLFLAESDKLDETLDMLLAISAHKTGEKASSDEQANEAERLRLQRMERIREMSGLYRNHTFDPSIFNIYDCGSSQIGYINGGKDKKTPDWTCCLNSSLVDYCNNNWFDGIFFLHRLANAQNTLLHSYFQDLKTKVDSERISDLREDQSKFYRKIVELGASGEVLASDQVYNVLGLYLGIDKLVYNPNSRSIHYARNTLFGPVLSISGDGEIHFQGLRLYSNLDKAKEKVYGDTEIREFKPTDDPTYIEVMENGTTALRAFIQSKGKGDSEESEEGEQPKMKPLTPEDIAGLSTEARFAYNIFAWRDLYNIMNQTGRLLLDQSAAPLGALVQPTSA